MERVFQNSAPNRVKRGSYGKPIPFGRIFLNLAYILCNTNYELPNTAFFATQTGTKSGTRAGTGSWTGAGMGSGIGTETETETFE